ncbi:DNA methyltransferase [Dehalococcoides mccartyi]|jgi:hypothetical protein|uniref:DNA methyltransferase n=1 Tax=Dehalococcoides mccartyi TaxID=61435 RepID=UPI0026F30DB2|nr:DNA methyltransferase [Dehalococcoides mccartyi]
MQEKSINLMTIKEASKWASEYLGKDVTASNISYLLQYGRVENVSEDNKTLIPIENLINYYLSIKKKERDWVDKLGSDINWSLSFNNLKESERTKHVHRLHPYKGKFIPQLVEYFLDEHLNDFKNEIYFHKGDIVLDPFCGSGTTLVQANELGIHAIGVDISNFNSLITNVKIAQYNELNLSRIIDEITIALQNFTDRSRIIPFERELEKSLSDFNNKYFPSPEFKVQIRLGLVCEDDYGLDKSRLFEPIYLDLVKKYSINLDQANIDSFIDKWYISHIRQEVMFVRDLIMDIRDPLIKNLMITILSRTMRSCRATTHSDLATLKDPVVTPYYCHKHGKICKPIFSILQWWSRYCKDTIKRINQFSQLKTNTFQVCLTGDSRSIDLVNALEITWPSLAHLVKKQRIKGVFSSPPYVGLIDYHDQHAYSYDLFRFERRDDLEIGALSKGQGIEARQSYIQSITDVIMNCRKWLSEDFNIFLVANDKYDLYPEIVENSGMKIVNKHVRPVLNRTERDKNAYSETIFHIKER